MGIEWQTGDSDGDGIIDDWFYDEDGPEGSYIFASVDRDLAGFTVSIGWEASIGLDEYSRGDGLVRFTLERVHKTSEEARATAARCIEFFRDLAAVSPQIIDKARQAVNGGTNAANNETQARRSNSHRSTHYGHDRQNARQLHGDPH